MIVHVRRSYASGIMGGMNGGLAFESFPHEDLPAKMGEQRMWDQLFTSWWVWMVPLAYLAVLVYAFNPKRKTQFEDDARIPLDDDRHTRR